MKTKSNSKNTNKTDSGLLNRTAKVGGGEATLMIDFGRRSLNRGLSVEALLALIQGEAPQFWAVVEVVGKWVWIQFEDKQPRQVTVVLAELGFHWNNKRQVWQHPCGAIGEASLYDPRRKYRSYFPAAEASS